ncbi:MAG: DnaJ domain-containing protein [Huintestinicola sp.]
MADPYAVLGVDRNASDDEIKKAYRKLVKQYHPDLHPDDAAAAAKMSEVNAAYEQLKEGGISGREQSAYSYSEPSRQSGYTYTNADFDFSAFEEFARYFSGFQSYQRGQHSLDKAAEYINSGRYEAALQYLNGLDSTLRTACWDYYCAASYYGLGDLKTAQEFAESAVRKEPSSESYRELLYRIQNESRRVVFTPRFSLGKIFLWFIIINMILRFITSLALIR